MEQGQCSILIKDIMKELDNISKEAVLYDLERNYSLAKQVYDGNLDGMGLSKEGAFRRMQVYNYAIKNLK